MLSEARPAARAARSPAAHGVACSGQPQGHAKRGAILEDLRSAAVPCGARSAPFRRAACSHAPTSGMLQRPPKEERFQHGWYDELDVDVDVDVPGVGWLLLATDPWNILLNTGGMLDATGLQDIGELKEAICVRAQF